MSKSGKKRRREAWGQRVPVATPGGIRVQNLRNLQARPWWARRWLETLESFMLGARLGRGRAYAASGQIRELHITPGLVSATVQGADPKPYATQIQLRTPDPATLEIFNRALLENPVWSARLAIREFPEELEAFFNTQKFPLFPTRENDLVMRCTCRDWAKPCKHVAALFYVMAEAVERDPRLMLTLRGLEQPDTPTSRHADTSPDTPTRRHADTSQKSVESFWSEKAPAFHDFGHIPKAAPAPLFRTLGPFPFWRGVERFLETMDNVHSRATSLGVEISNGTPHDFTPVKPEPEKPLFYPSQGRFRIDPMLR